MITPGSRLRQIGWAVVLAACIGLFLALSFRVHAVRSEVLLAERQIIALERETLMLETEFQTRASQRQLAEWNTVEFGYQAPRPDQYLMSERQLASLSVPLGPSAPAPVRFAQADTTGDESGEGATRLALADAPMVSPVSGRTIERVTAQASEDASFAEAFGEILTEAAIAGAEQARNLDASALNASAGDGRNYLSSEAAE
ncbi:hypothetical protein ACRAQ6_07260 [Erythrobacter sp. HA6-11]